jgi:hypothetical protein
VWISPTAAKRETHEVTVGLVPGPGRRCSRDGEPGSCQHHGVVRRVYLVGGPARVGKSSLAHRLLRGDGIPWLPTDVMRTCCAGRYRSSTTWIRATCRRRGGRADVPAYRAGCRGVQRGGRAVPDRRAVTRCSYSSRVSRPAAVWCCSRSATCSRSVPAARSRESMAASPSAVRIHATPGRPGAVSARGWPGGYRGRSAHGRGRGGRRVAVSGSVTCGARYGKPVELPGDRRRPRRVRGLDDIVVMLAGLALVCSDASLAYAHARLGKRRAAGLIGGSPMMPVSAPAVDGSAPGGGYEAAVASARRCTVMYAGAASRLAGAAVPIAIRLAAGQPAIMPELRALAPSDILRAPQRYAPLVQITVGGASGCPGCGCGCVERGLGQPPPPAACLD